MNVPRIALNVSSIMFSKLVDLGSRVIVGITGNLHFATPAPTIAALQTQVDDTQAAIAAWGTRGNRGSHVDYVNLKEQALTLHQMLKAMAQYVENTAELTAGNDFAYMATIMSGSGFDLVRTGSPVGVLEAAQNLHSFKSRSMNLNQGKLKWKRPLNTTSTADVDGYAVYKGTTPVFSDASQVAITSKAVYLDVNTSNVAVTWYYWVVPFNAAGFGATSDVVVLNLWAA